MGDHIALFVGIIRQFCNGKKTWVHDFIRKKTYFADPIRIGSENGYYSKECETYLGNNFETKFCDLIQEVFNMETTHAQTNLLNEKFHLLNDFIKFQFLRSKCALNLTNEHCLTRLVFGPIKHDDLILIMKNEQDSLLDYIQGNICAVIVTNESSEYSFINNSLGFYTINHRLDNFAICIPISPKLLIHIGKVNEKHPSHYVADTEGIIELNTFCYKTEIDVGNGFLIAKSKKDFQSIKNPKESI